MRAGHPAAVTSAERGRSSGVEHNLAKVGVEGSNPFARSRLQNKINRLVAETLEEGLVHWREAGAQARRTES